MKPTSKTALLLFKTTKTNLYFDVVTKGLDKLAFFGLYSANHTYVVDLFDGHFEVDGVEFRLQPCEDAWITLGGTYKLVYWRDHQHDYGLEPAHRMQWRFGWKYEDPSGQIHTQTMVVS